MTEIEQLVKKNRKTIEKYEEDFQYIYDKFKELEEEIAGIQERLIDQKVQTAEYIREMTDLKFRAYQELLKAKGGNKTQTEIAEELEIDDAVLSRFKQDFKENNIL